MFRMEEDDDEKRLLPTDNQVIENKIVSLKHNGKQFFIARQLYAA